MLEKLKQHPWLIAGLVGVFVIVLIFSGSKSTTTAADQGTADSSQAANAYNNAQSQIAANLQMAQLQSGVQSQQVAGAVTVAQLQAGVADNANTLAAQVAEYTTAANRDVALNHDTLSAQIAQSNNQSQVQIAQTQAAVSMANTSTLANALVTQSQTQAAVAMNASNNQASTFANYINVLPSLEASHDAAAVGVAQANAPQPCSSFLFGLISSC